MAEFKHRSDLLGIFANHKVAANLLMAIMIIVGILGYSRLNTQFLPNFALDYITVRVVWPGASAEDVERSISIPIEQELRTVDSLRNLTSTSAEGVAAISLEFNQGTDMAEKLDLVKQQVSQVRNLPSTAEDPVVTKIVRYENIARVLLHGDFTLAEMRPMVREMENDLLARGIARVSIAGLPDEQIQIQISNAELGDLQQSLAQVATQVGRLSQDTPAGKVGRGEVAKQLRSLDKRQALDEFNELPLLADGDGRYLRLGDIAKVEKGIAESSKLMFKNGYPAVELTLQRAETTDALKSADILNEWVADVVPTLPDTVKVDVFDQRWSYIDQRIQLLVKNGLGGLLLVVGILYLFLNGRVAFWVTVGIPTTFLATLAVLYAVGGTINMVSLFGLIMALGIIVDDAIVVGEDALAHYEKGENSLQAAEGGARRMLAPVFSSSLTTVAAFVPLMSIGGIIGNILFDIPLVVICVIVASLVECFLVLPGHLRHSFMHMMHKPPSKFRVWFDTRFDAFREQRFRAWVETALAYRWVVITATTGTLVVFLAALVMGMFSFRFFPSPEASVIFANVSFISGTSKEQVHDFLVDVEDALIKTNENFGGNLVVNHVMYTGGHSGEGASSSSGENLGGIKVELIDADQREVRNPAFIRAWKKDIVVPASVENFSLTAPRGGPPGKDIDVLLSGGALAQLKAASEAVQTLLRDDPAVTTVYDDLPYGQEQLIFTLTPEGRVLGLTAEEIGRQLRAAFTGQLAQILQDGVDDVEVRVMLPKSERDSLATIERFQVQLPSGGIVPLGTVVAFETRQGFDAIRHDSAQRAIHVLGEVDATRGNAHNIRENLRTNVLPDIAQRYGVSYVLKGKAEEQAETTGDMKTGAIVALVMIYIVLAWVFSSYGWPLVVMSVIPFGLIGALFGHMVMGLDLTILSFFGMFGLMGILVNDSIILVTFYKELREQGVPIMQALSDAACLRLRAVLLTSLTTIGGLVPLLFEKSLQAQFLIPMATSIAFGLALATVLVLFVIPSLLLIYENGAENTRRLKQWFWQQWEQKHA